MKREMKNTKAFLNGYTVVAIILFAASSCQRGDHSTEDDKQKELESRVELLESRVELLLDRSQMEEAKQRAQQEGFDVHEIKPQQSR
jgi:outer membrane murein-binding lipoprotein Lpp